MICKICQNKKLKYFAQFPFFDLYYCNNCKTYPANGNFDKKFLTRVYSESYFNFWKGTSPTLTDKVKSEVRKMKRETFGEYLKIISKHHKLKGSKLLDIGCATGYLLELAQEKGCDCSGVEVSSFAAKEASKKFPKRIFNGTIEQAKYKDKQFDIITMIDLLEHVTDPIKTLNEVKRILKPDGYILIVTPNIDSVWVKLLGKKWTNFKEEHIFYFSPISLKFMTEKTNLKIIYQTNVIKYLTLEYIYSHFVSYPTPFFGQISKVTPLLPKVIRIKPFPIRTGDYLVLLKNDTN